MNTIILIIVLQVIVISITGCSMLEEKMNRAQGLSCPTTVHSICEPNESLLICDSADKTECYGQLREEKVWIIE